MIEWLKNIEWAVTMNYKEQAMRTIGGLDCKMGWSSYDVSWIARLQFLE